jgi:hypothetical protein
VVKSHPHLVVRDALAELFVGASAGDPEADRRLEALEEWARDGAVTPPLLAIPISEDETLFARGALGPKLAALEPYIRDRVRRFAAARAWIRAEGSETDPLERARAAWDAGLYIEVHEILEPVWLEEVEPKRTPLQGLILAAAALHHLEGGNRAGAISLALKAAPRLREAPPGFPIEVDPLASALESLAKKVEHGEIRTPKDVRDVPPFRTRSSTSDPS